MIHVDSQPEPADFDTRVRKPGRRFLRGHPKPTQTEWRNHAYWSKISKELHIAYGGICAYSCHWISYDTGWRTVEHFYPKSRFPKLAYEWGNYRLVCGALNGRKGYAKILDPFAVENGWFTIEFPSLLVKPALNLAARLAKKVAKTCDVLGLNDEATCMKTRATYIGLYCERKVTFAYLEQEAPFIANELIRQGLSDVDVLQRRMGYL